MNKTIAVACIVGAFAILSVPLWYLAYSHWHEAKCAALRAPYAKALNAFVAIKDDPNVKKEDWNQAEMATRKYGFAFLDAGCEW